MLTRAFLSLYIFKIFWGGGGGMPPHPLMARAFGARNLPRLVLKSGYGTEYALPTSPTRSDKPYPTPPRSANAPETNAPSLTPDCVYEEMQSTSSRATAAINNTLVGQHASSMTA